MACEKGPGVMLDNLLKMQSSLLDVFKFEVQKPNLKMNFEIKRLDLNKL